jgi:ABC-2 type transport system permease protein
MLLGTVSWNLSYIFFLKVITTKVKSIAGYDFNDMMVFTFVTEIIFYITWIFAYQSSERFVDLVKEGGFDMLLIKPVSLLLQVSTIRISVFETLFSGIGPLCIYAYLIYSTHEFSPSARQIFLSIFTGIIGIGIVYSFRYAYAMVVFWIKQARNLMKTLGFLSDIGSFPIEAYAEPMRTSLTFVAPAIVAAGVPGSYLLGKTESLDLLVYQLIIFAVFTGAFLFLWKKGLPLYESASS